MTSIAVNLHESMPPAVNYFLEYADRPTRLHSIRVAQLSRLGAQVMGFDGWQQDRVELAGLAHDIGKQNPTVNAIINSGNPLSAAERKIVNLHAQIGFELLWGPRTSEPVNVRAKLGDFLGTVALDVLFSHSFAVVPAQRGANESYLSGLVNKCVISKREVAQQLRDPASQLLAVADVTDALLSSGAERSYRQSRLKAENRPPAIDVITLPEMVADIIDVPAVDLEKVVPALIEVYPDIKVQAEQYSI